MSKDFSKTYTKRALTIHQQIELLEKRGLIINDREEVSHYLQHIGYYHLSTYFKIFQDDNIFIQNTSFEDVLKVYRFDKRLRLVFQNTLEMIEKSFRANLSNHLSIKYDNPFYLTEGPQKENFTPLLQSAIKKSKEPFLDYYKNTYSNSYPPIWMLIQIISWGELLHMYNFLERDDKQSIAKKYGYGWKYLLRWMHNLREIRNICAHHSYLWNKTLSNHILKDKDVSIFQYNNKIYDSIIITQKLLNQITPGYDFFQDIEHLISHYEIQYLEEMGFPENWKDVFDTNRPDSSE